MPPIQRTATSRAAALLASLVVTALVGTALTKDGRRRGDAAGAKADPRGAEGEAPARDVVAETLRRHEQAILELRCATSASRSISNGAVYALLCVPPIWTCVALAGPDPVFSVSPAYRVMGHLMAEQVWAGGSGIMAFFCVLLGVTRERRAVVLGALLLGLWHGLVSVCVFVGNPTSIGTAPFVVLASIAYMVLWKAW